MRSAAWSGACFNQNKMIPALGTGVYIQHPLPSTAASLHWNVNSNNCTGPRDFKVIFLYYIFYSYICPIDGG